MEKTIIAVQTESPNQATGSSNGAPPVQQGSEPTTVVQPAVAYQTNEEPRIEILPVGAKFHGPVPRMTVREFMATASRRNKSSLLQLADCVQYLRDQFGYVSMLELAAEIGVDEATLRTALWIANNVPIEIRIEGLTLQHYRVVASLDEDDEKAKFLKLAAEQHLSASKLKEQIAATKPADEADDDDDDDDEEDLTAVWREAREFVGKVKMTWGIWDEETRKVVAGELKDLMAFVNKPKEPARKRKKSKRTKKAGAPATKPAQSDTTSGEVVETVPPAAMPVKPEAAVIAAAANPAAAIAAAAEIVS
jgi:hypothetical protein